MKAADAQEKLREIADLKIAEHSRRFFKTGPANMVKAISFWEFECRISEK